jgi:branched-chain amino acid transport system substrate-binding protein
VPGYYTDVGLIIRQARDLKIGVPILGGDGWDSPRLIEIAGKGIGSVFFSNHFVSSGNTSKVVSSFVYRYQKLYNRLPGSAAGLAYDSALVLLDAMSRASPLDRSTLNESLKTVNNIDGVTGKISIGPDRNAVKEAIVVSVRNGEFVRAW